MVKKSIESETNLGRIPINISIDKNGNEETINIEAELPRYGIRHIQTLLLFFLLFVAYMLRVNLSVAIVAMVNKNATNLDFKEFSWEQSTQSVVLSSFFWGYVILQIPAGPLAKLYGSKILLLIAFTIGSILTILTPYAAEIGEWRLLCALRVVQGLTQSFVFPCSHTLLTQWTPPAERGRLATFVYAGSQLGTVFMLAVSGVIASSPLGWPGIFYISGAISLLWVILWSIFGANNPSESTWISKEEKDYIEKSTGMDSDEKPKNTPWGSILTSIPFWSLILVHCAHNWGFCTLLTKMPTYMNDILNFNIKSNALLSALPYFVMWMLSFVMSYSANYMNNRQIVSEGTSRKIFNTIGHWIPMLLLIPLGYVTEANKNVGVVLLTLAVGANAGTYVGYLINHMDLSPNFAGVLMGITNFVANWVSIMAPLGVGFIVGDGHNPDPAKWRIVFFITAGIYLIGNLIFVIFGQATVQPWNNCKNDEEKNQSEKSKK